MGAENQDKDLLDLAVGTTLQVQLAAAEKPQRHLVRLIGYLPGGSLVTTMPTVNGKVQIVREGQRFAVRALKGERVMGFVARVLDISMKPYPHMHLEYPGEFEQILVRNASRVMASIAASVRNTKDENDAQNFVAATIVDLSETGAKLASDTVIADQEQMLHIKFVIEVSGGTEQLGLLGLVRNVNERVDKEADQGQVRFLTGIQFQNLSRYQQILLHAWVANETLKNALRGQAG